MESSAESQAPRKPEPHPGWVALAITLMAFVVAVIVDRLGLLADVDRMLAARVEELGLDGGVEMLAPAWSWLWLAVAAAGGSFLILQVEGQLRRAMLTLTLMVLHFSWVPILALCGRTVAVAPVSIGVFWAAVCSLVYALRHREPARN